MCIKGSSDMATKGVRATAERSPSVPVGDDRVRREVVVVEMEGVGRFLVFFAPKLINFVFRAVLGIERKVYGVLIYSLSPFLHPLPQWNDSEDFLRDKQEVLVTGQSWGGEGGGEGTVREDDIWVPGLGSWRWRPQGSGLMFGLGALSWGLAGCVERGLCLVVWALATQVSPDPPGCWPPCPSADPGLSVIAEWPFPPATAFPPDATCGFPVRHHRTLYPLRVSVGEAVAHVSPSPLASKLRQHRACVFFISCHTQQSLGQWGQRCRTSTW